MHCFGQQGLVPALDSDKAEVITGSEFIVKAYSDCHSLTVTAINDLITNVLKTAIPQFNVDEFDTNMLQRLSASIDSGDLQIISMRKEGDGAQNTELFKRQIEKVLRRELIGDMLLAGKQHFAFREYKDPHGNRMFAGDANRAVSFQLAQARIGPNNVPVSIQLYIDGTYLSKGIPMHLIYGEYQCDEAVRVRCNEMK
jgi:hypothetical protein